MKRRDDRTGDAALWIALGLAGVYIAIHLPMLARSLVLWGGLVNALFGQ